MKTKSALSYFGSDSQVAPRLASLLDECNHVTIPFCGGMSILPHLKAKGIVANDSNNAVINFYRNMSCDKNRPHLIDMCRRTLSHPLETEEAKEILDKSRQATINQLTLPAAWAFWSLCWVGRKGKGGTRYMGGLPSVRRTAGGGNNATRLRAVASDLERWAKHFERCEFESVDFRRILRKVADNPKCGVYIDPPWIGAGDNYLYSFTRGDHIDLSIELSRFVDTKVVVRYGDDPFVRGLYKDWNVIEESSRDQCNSTKNEVWFTNKHD